MAVDLTPADVTANAVAPGPTETELFGENNLKGSEGEKHYLARVPMARFASPEEIAATIAFLAGEKCGIHYEANIICGREFEPWNDLTGKVRPESGSGLQNFGR